MTVEAKTFFITRPTAGSLVAGGMDRLTVWARPPRLRHSEEALGDLLLSSWRHEHAVPGLAGKIFRKTNDRIRDAIWDEVVTGAFPGIPHADWEVALRDHPDSIPHLDWIGQFVLLSSLSPFPEAFEQKVVVTGPYDERARWTEPGSAFVEDAIVWIGVPRFQDMSGFPADPLDGKPQLDHWWMPGYGGRPFMSREAVRLSGWRTLAEGVDLATWGTTSTSRGWSASFSIWLDARSTEGDERDWDLETWL